MSQINPFAGSILQTSQVQRQQATEKDHQARHVRDLAKNSALAEEKLQSEVESSEEVTPVHEEEKRERRFKRGKHTHHDAADNEKDDGTPHLDLTA